MVPIFLRTDPALTGEEYAFGKDAPELEETVAMVKTAQNESFVGLEGTNPILDLTDHVGLLVNPRTPRYSRSNATFRPNHVGNLQSNCNLPSRTESFLH